MHVHWLLLPSDFNQKWYCNSYFRNVKCDKLSKAIQDCRSPKRAETVDKRTLYCAVTVRVSETSTKQIAYI